MTRYTYEEVTKTLKTDEGLSVKDKALFHYFNPNGAYATKKVSDDLINHAVTYGKLRSGAVYAYGSLNDYGVERLYRAVSLQRPRRFDVDYAVRWILSAAKEATKRAEEAMEA